MTLELSRRSFLQSLSAGAAVVGVTPGIASASIPDPDVQHPIKNLERIQTFYSSYPDRVRKVREAFGRPLTMSEKILFSHLYDIGQAKNFRRGSDYAYFRPDHLIMQDLLAQTAMLQFMTANFPRVAIPTSIHCDHLTVARVGAKKDLMISNEENRVVYKFLKDTADKFGCDFWEPGAGIIHQQTLENYAFPGCLIVGTDSHTPNASGLGGMAIGVGGADAVDCMAGMEWELLVPKVIGVHVTGELNGWTTPKDIILKLLGILTVKGGTNAIIEFFGDGIETISASGKATISNMGAELGATSSVFPYDSHIMEYLRKTGRAEINYLARPCLADLRADPEVYAQPEKYFDQVIELDLNTLEPQVSGPFTPDAAMNLSEMKQKVIEKKLSDKVEAALIGSCTNSSYEDITRALDLIKQAADAGLETKCPLFLAPGSNLILSTMQRDGMIDTLNKFGVTLLASACGPCVGQWIRSDMPKRKNTIVSAFNRNFRKRTDRNPLTENFLVSPDLAVAYAFGGSLSFNPITDTIKTKDGKDFKFRAAKGSEVPVAGYAKSETGCIEPTFQTKEISIDPNSDRIALLEPFPAWDHKDMLDLPLLVKVKGKCTTDHICPGRIQYVGNIPKMSENTLSVAQNAFVPNQFDHVWSQTDNKYETIYQTAMGYKNKGIGSVIVGDENYGEGSSREQAALQPRYLNCKAVLVKSFARIHESNLKKQGLLPLTFVNTADYDRIQEKDKISILGLADLAPGKPVQVVLSHENGSKETIQTQHSCNERQLEWFRYGSALNMLREKQNA